jgi:sulfate adenylyltransferase subunit 2
MRHLTADLLTSQSSPDSSALRAARAPLDSHLAWLEAEAIEIFREVVAEFENPVMLYSVGKDSAVMLHLALKAFHPTPLPFPLLHIDTGYKPSEMITFRDRIARAHQSAVEKDG